MEQEKKTQIVSLIKLMVKEGTSIEAVRETLKESGIADDEIEKFVAEAGGPSHKEIQDKVDEIRRTVAEQPKLEHLEDNTRKTEEVRQKMSELQGEASSQSEKLELLGSSIDEQYDKLESLNKGVSALSEKHERITENLSEVSLLKYEVREIKNMLIEMKPMIAALSNLNEKILEANQNVLMRLKKE